jgi:hypothetical protein
MKATLGLFVFLVVGIVAATTDAANAVVYCQYIDYPPSCVARPGVVLKPRVVIPPRIVAPRARRAIIRRR